MKGKRTSLVIRRDGCSLPRADRGSFLALADRQLLEQRLGVFQIRRLEALGEPAIDGREQVVGLPALALLRRIRAQGK